MVGTLDQLASKVHEPGFAYLEANAEQGRRMEAIAGYSEDQVIEGSWAGSDDR